jgi:predicted nucleic acid-binding protein
MKEVFFINTNYKNIENKYEIKEDIALITLLKKDGSELIAKIDATDIEKVKSAGTWFAEWHKDFNNYTVQNISSTKTNKQAKPLKQSLQSVILDTTTNAPIKHINGDTLDNRKCNLEIVERNTKNEYKIVDEYTVAIILKDKLGKAISKALISKEDLDAVITDEYSWVEYKSQGNISVIANTPAGRIHLDKILMNPSEGETIHHINLNPLDNRRSNLEIVKPQTETL